MWVRIAEALGLAHHLEDPIEDFKGLLRGDVDGLPILIDLLKHEEAIVRDRAASALGKLGPNAKEAFPALVEFLKENDSGDWQFAVYALREIDPERTEKDVVPILIDALNDPDKRYGTSFCLEILGPLARSAFPNLLDLIEDKAYRISGPAAKALMKIDDKRAGKRAISVFIQALKNEDSWVRLHAAGDLEDIGPAAEAAIPELNNALMDEEPDVRLAAAAALEKIKQSRIQNDSHK